MTYPFPWAPPDFERLLEQAEHPAHYLGTEWNSVRKDPARMDLRVALAFPDTYEMSLGNLGLLILYGVLNDLPWCAAERAYAPAGDMEALLRARNMPLFALESKDPLSAFDLVGFTLQSELTYTNVLNMLDLGGIPLRAEQRDEGDPLVCAGGPTACNPEPMAPFFDFMVVGDAEAAIVQVVESLRATKGRRRRERLEALAQIEGVYVPALVAVEPLEDGTLVPVKDAPITRRRVEQDLNAAPFPAHYLVPYAQQVHDRVGLEVLRGCTHGCRFCQAGIVQRPVRERSPERVHSIMKDALGHTGYEEVSLLSLSTCDHSRIGGLLKDAAGLAAQHDAGIALPSLRLDTFSVQLADGVTGVRRSGLTLAPEAATPRMRSVINKYIPDEQLFGVIREAFRKGWRHIKLYFMIGLPTERDEDLAAIADLCIRALEAARSVNRSGRINTGISTFVPKPWTPFQWAPQISIGESRRRQQLLGQGFAQHRAIKFGRHTPESSFVEGLISRGDRGAADLIEAAWRNGAKQESSDEWLRLEPWQQAICELDYNVDKAFSERDPKEPLPWDHVDALVSKAWLRDEWRRAQALETTPDCRAEGCRSCGVDTPENPRCQPILERMREARRETPPELPSPPPKQEEPPPAQRLRFRIGREGPARFLSHLEWATAWNRLMRRAGFDLAHSQGFHTHPKVSFSTALPVGEESEAEYMDVVLRQAVPPEEALRRVRRETPEGFLAFEAEEVPLKSPALMAQAAGFRYVLRAPAEPASIEQAIAGLLAAGEFCVQRKLKAKKRRPGGPNTREVNVRDSIVRLELTGKDPVCVELEVNTGQAQTAKPKEVARRLGLPIERLHIRKTATLLSPE